MMFKRSNIFKRFLRSQALRFFHFLENDGNCDFKTNGEQRFTDNLFEYLKKNSPGEMTIFDVGANVGKYSEMILGRADLTGKLKLHVFEPTASCMEALEGKFKGRSEVFLNKLAVSNRVGTSELFYDRKQSGLASLHKRNLSAYSITMNESEMVETIRLDGYIGKNRIEHISFLKVDVEGHELAVFDGLGEYLSGDFMDFIQFEYGGANLDSHSSLMEFFELFGRSGFKVAKVMPRGLEIRRYEPWMDNFQYSNYVAISEKVMKKLER